MSTEFDIRFAIDPAGAAGMGTAELRENFLIDDLFADGAVRWTYTHYDRMAVGGAVPTSGELALETIKPTGTANFLDRRELIAVNIGEAGTITIDGTPTRSVLATCFMSVWGRRMCALAAPAQSTISSVLQPMPHIRRRFCSNLVQSGSIWAVPKQRTNARSFSTRTASRAVSWWLA